MNKVKKNWLLLLTIGVVVLVVGVGLLIKPIVRRNEVLAKFPDRGVPRMNITLNGASLEDINSGSKETKYEGNEVTVYEGGDVTLEASGVRVKGRGNTTWEQEKKPYQIRFSRKVDLFGMGRNKKWVMLANYYDTSSMRNDVAMMLAEMLEVRFNVRGKFVEVYFDGNYEGLYYILPKIEIADESVDLREPDGVLFELDSLHRYDENCYESYLNDCLVLKDAVVEDDKVIEGAVEIFMRDFDEFEKEAKGGNYGRVAELVDVDSFAKYFLVNEFTVNPDAYLSSFFIYRDGSKDKIHVGPVWDFDLALGNRNWSQQADETFYSPDEEMVRKIEVFTPEGLNEYSFISRVMYYLEEIPEFRDRITSLFKEKMSGRGVEFENTIMNTMISLKDAIRRNNDVWGIGDYEDEGRKLMEWISKRYAFFETNYGE